VLIQAVVHNQQSSKLFITCVFVFLNGWVVQVLANGEEVKLQRNALSVVEYGPEDVQVR
jgi:hypothetical protein